jgi:adenylate kinase
MNILLIGAQGSGKGTQAAQLSEVLGICNISSGDLFRETLKEKTAFSVKVKSYLDRGALVPDEITAAMVLGRIAQPDCIPGVLLDGFPRTIAQAKILDEGLHGVGQSIDQALYLEVPRAELLRRLSGRYICRAHQHIYNIVSQPPKVAGICDIDGSELYQRTDDKGEAVQKRLDIFFSETIQLLDYYDRQQKLVTINGHQDIDKVHFDLLSAINSVVFNAALGNSVATATKFPSRFYACEQ